MDEATRKFLADNLIPPHICVLMEFYGVSFIHDLYEFGEDDVKEIEGSVREGTIGGQTDLNDASNLLKFLGSLHADYTKWSFRPIDKKKLLRLSDLAKKKLQDEIGQKPPVAVKAEPVHKSSMEKYPRLGNDGAVKGKRSSLDPDISYTNFDESSSITTTDKIKSPIKRTCNRKTYAPSKVEAKGESGIAPMIKMYTDKTITAVNEILNMKEISILLKSAEQIDKTHVEVTYNSTKRSFKISAQCVICGNQVSLSRTPYSISARNYELHISRIHLAPCIRTVKQHERILNCNACSETFKTLNCLRTHRKIHRVKPIFECDNCELKYSRKFDIQEHMNAVHLGTRDHMCSICGKCFSRVTALRSHLNGVHLKLEKGLLTQQCTVCGFQTINKTKLERHMKSHTGERNFECGICGKRFLYDYNVTAHIKHVHNREKRKVNLEKLTCKFCGQKFSRIWKMKKHMTQAHNLIQVEEAENFELILKCEL